MSVPKITSLCIMLSLSLIQAAAHPDKKNNDKLALPDCITLPTLHTAGRGKIVENISLESKDHITKLTFKQHIKQADEHDLPWIMIAYVWLSKKQGPARKYADAIAFHNNYYYKSMPYSTYYAFTISQENQGQIDVKCLNSQDELNNHNNILSTLINAASSHEFPSEAEHQIAEYFYDNHDYKHAQKWHEQAALKGSIAAMIALGTSYSKQENKAPLYWEVQSMINQSISYCRQKDTYHVKILLKKLEEDIKTMIALGTSYSKQEDKAPLHEEVQSMINQSILYCKQKDAYNTKIWLKELKEAVKSMVK